MKEFLLFGLLPALAVTTVALRLAERRLARIDRRGLRWFARGVAVLGGLVLIRVLIPTLGGPLDRGTWFCSLCGALEERTTYLGVVVQSASPEEPAEELERAASYAQWFTRTAQPEPEHAWIPVGCHQVGWSTIACSMSGVCRFHRALPRVPDEEAARELLLRLARAAPSRRREMLLDFEFGDPGLFEPLASGAILSREEFRSAYETWLTRHPLWQ